MPETKNNRKRSNFRGAVLFSSGFRGSSLHRLLRQAKSLRHRPAEARNQLHLRRRRCDRLRRRLPTLNSNKLIDFLSNKLFEHSMRDIVFDRGDAVEFSHRGKLVFAA